MKNGLHFGLSGRYKIAIVDSRSKRVLWEQAEWQNNLILNDGFERIATNVVCDNFLYAYAGTGSRTNNVSSGVDTAACDVAGNVTLPGGSTFVFDNTVPGDLQNIIKWDNTGFEGRITSISTNRACVVTPTPSVPQSGTFVFYRTNQTGLQTEVKRTSTYLAVAPACSSFVAGNIVTHQRTWDFSAEAGTVVYQEFGVGWSTTPNTPNTTFARFLLHSPITVNVTQQLRVLYQTREVFGPTTPFVKTAVISGWPLAPATNTQGQEQFQRIGMSAVNSDGSTGTFDAGANANEPSHTANVQVFLATNSSALTAFGALPVDRSSGAAVKDVTTSAYVPFSGSMIKQVTYQTAEALSSSWRAMGVGTSVAANPSRDAGLCFLFDQAQTKNSGKTLNLQFFYNWSRVLGS